jgi:hypothetical protein
VADQDTVTVDNSVALRNNFRDDGTIVPGFGTHQLNLFQGKAEVLKAMGKPSEEYQYPSHDNCPEFSELHWIGPIDNDPSTVEGDGTFAYIQAGKVFQLAYSGPMYRTVHDIGFLSPLADVKRLLPDATDYVLIGSADKLNGGKDLKYVVWDSSGLGLEFSPGGTTENEVLWRIYVFPAHSEFVPRGCIDESRQLRRLPR